MVSSLRPVPPHPASGLIEVATSIWTIEAQHCVCYRPPMQPRYPYPHRAVVIRLSDRSLFVISPVPLTPEIRQDLDSLGSVKYLVSPNHLHHLALGDWHQAYPAAKLYASPRLPAKRKDLPFTKTLSTDSPEPEWAGQIDQCLFGSGNGWIDELVFYHRDSRTVIFTDLIMDFDPATFSALSQVTTRWNQMYQHTPRGVQLGHIFDRAALQTALKTVQSWQPERVIVAHSPWLCVEGQADVTTFLDQAFDWLQPRSPFVESLGAIARLLLLLFVILPIHTLIVLLADILYPKLMGQNPQP